LEFEEVERIRDDRFFRKLITDEKKVGQEDRSRSQKIWKCPFLGRRFYPHREILEGRGPFPRRGEFSEENFR